MSFTQEDAPSEPGKNSGLVIVAGKILIRLCVHVSQPANQPTNQPTVLTCILRSIQHASTYQAAALPFLFQSCLILFALPEYHLSSSHTHLLPPLPAISQPHSHPFTRPHSLPFTSHSSGHLPATYQPHSQPFTSRHS